MSEILMPIVMFILLLLGAGVLLTSFFITLAAILGWFHRDEYAHLHKQDLDVSC